MNSEEKDIAVAKVIGLYDRFVVVKHGHFYRPNACGYTIREDEEPIMAAARSHGFVLVSSRKAKAVAFVRGKA